MELISSLLPLLIILFVSIFVLILDIIGDPVKHWIPFIGIFGYILGLFSLQFVETNSSVPGFHVDSLGLMGIFLVFICGLAVMIYSYSFLQFHGSSPTEWTFLMLSSSLGLCMMFLTEHLLVLFIGLEMSSLAFYVLCGYLLDDRRSMESSLKYFVLGSVGSAILLLGIALLFMNQQTLIISEFNFGNEFGLAGYIMSTGILFLGLAFKLSLVPFHFWVPDVYEGAPTPLTGYMSVAVKIAVLTFMIRFFSITVDEVLLHWKHMFWWLATVTIIVGNIIALAQTNIKRMLAYSSVSHAGYMTLGLVAANTMGYEAILFYLAIYVCMNFISFGVVSLLERSSNRDRPLKYADLRGFSRTNPVMAFSLAVAMISLSGLPPTGGFIGKFLLFNGVIKAGFPGLAVVAVFGSLISVGYYFRVIVNSYMVDPAENSEHARIRSGPTDKILTITLMVLILSLGILPHKLLMPIRNVIEALVR